MDCPYCGKEMKKGRIYGARGGLSFIEDEEKRKALLFPKIIELTSIWDGRLKSDYCGNCNKIIIDVEL